MSESAYIGLPHLVEIRVANRTPVFTVNHDAPLTEMTEQERRQLADHVFLGNLGIPAYGLFSDHPPPLSFEALDDHGSPALSLACGVGALYLDGARRRYTELWSGIPPTYRRPSITIEGGEDHCFVFDLGPWLRSLAPGEYQLVVGVHAHLGAAPYASATVPVSRSAPQRFRLRPMTDVAEVLVQQARPARSEAPDRLGPEEWMGPNVDVDILRAGLSQDEFSQLSPYLFLGGAARTGVVALAPIDLLDSFPAHLEPLAEVLRYEVLSDMGDEFGASEIRQAIDPGLGWQLDQVDEGNGLIRQAIRVANPWASQLEDAVPGGESPE